MLRHLSGNPTAHRCESRRLLAASWVSLTRHHLPSSQGVRFAIRDFLADWVTAVQSFAVKTYRWIWRNS